MIQVVYRIREWQERYEVNEKGRVWVDGERKRHGALEYIRMPVHGRFSTRPWRRLNQMAGDDAPAVFGVFCKLMEIAADNKADLRGWIVDTDGTPLTTRDLSEILMWSEAVISLSLNILSSNGLRWIEAVSLDEFSGKSRNIPGNPDPDQIRSDHIRSDQPKTRARPRTKTPASADSYSASDSAGTSAGQAGSGPATANSSSAAAAGQHPGAQPNPANNLGIDPALTAPAGVGAAPAGAWVPAGTPGQGVGKDEQRLALNRLWTRIKKTTGDGKPYMDWWTAVLPTIVQHQQVHSSLLEALGYAEMCGDPAQREAKGLGELKRPGAYVTNQILAAARTSSVTLPDLPGRKGKEA